MINYTTRFDKALRRAAWAHEQQGQHRKGTDLPYIVHPFGAMLVASNVTEDEDTLIACLFHDILEDVDGKIYDEVKMTKEFGDNVVKIVKDVTKNDDITDWYERSKAYLNHLEQKACGEAVIVSAADKINNLMSVLIDYDEIGDQVWQKFTTKNADDQIWWYQSVLDVITRRKAPRPLLNKLSADIYKLKSKINLK